VGESTCKGQDAASEIPGERRRRWWRVGSIMTVVVVLMVMMMMMMMVDCYLKWKLGGLF